MALLIVSRMLVSCLPVIIDGEIWLVAPMEQISAPVPMDQPTLAVRASLGLLALSDQAFIVLHSKVVLEFQSEFATLVFHMMKQFML